MANLGWASVVAFLLLEVEEVEIAALEVEVFVEEVETAAPAGALVFFQVGVTVEQV